MDYLSLLVRTAMVKRDAERRGGEQSGSRFIDAVLQVVRNCLRVTGTKYACGVAKRGVGSVRGRSVMVVPTVTTLSRILPFQFPVSPTRNAAGPRRVEVWRTRVSSDGKTVSQAGRLRGPNS